MLSELPLLSSLLLSGDSLCTGSDEDPFADSENGTGEESLPSVGNSPGGGGVFLNCTGWLTDPTPFPYVYARPFPRPRNEGEGDDPGECSSLLARRFIYSLFHSSDPFKSCCGSTVVLWEVHASFLLSSFSFM